MKSTALVIAFLAAFPLAATAGVTKDDIKKLAENGISDGVIIAYIKANGPAPKLSADDILELKKAGVSDKVLETALASSKVVKPARTYTPPKTTTYVVQDYVPTYTYPRSYYYRSYPGYYYCPSYRYSYTYRGRSSRFGVRWGW